MATLTELQSRRAALAASRACGVARVSYDGKTVPLMCLPAKSPRSRGAGSSGKSA